MHIPGYSRIQSYSVVFTCPEKLFWVQSLKVLWRIELCSCRFLLFPVFLVTFFIFFRFATFCVCARVWTSRCDAVAFIDHRHQHHISSTRRGRFVFPFCNLFSVTFFISYDFYHLFSIFLYFFNIYTSYIYFLCNIFDRLYYFNKKFSSACAKCFA